MAALLAIAPLFIWEADADGRVTRSSDFGLDYLGMDLAQVQGEGWLAAVEPAARERVMAAWSQALAQGTRYEIEMPIRRASDGQRRLHLVRAEPIRAAAGDGQAARWIGIALDIHDARAASEALADREARLASIGDATAGFLYMKDRAGRMVWCNRAVLDALRKPAAEVIGRTDREFLRPGAHTDEIEAHDREVMDSGRAMVIEERLIDPPRVFTSTKTPWRDAAGRVVGLIGVSVNITALRATQTALAESRSQLREREARLAAALAAAGQRAWTYLPDERVFVVDGERVGERVLDAERRVTADQAWRGVPAGEKERLLRALDACTQELADFDETYRLVRADGEVRWLRSVGRAERDGGHAEQAAPRVHGVTMDLTEQRHAQAALEDSERRLRLAVSSSSLAWWDMDPKTRELSWSVNARRMFGFGDTDKIHLDAPIERIHPMDRARVLAAIEAAMDPAGDGTYSERYRVVWPDGTMRWIHALGGAEFMVGDGGIREPCNFSGVLWDITEPQRLHEWLTQSEARMRLAIDSVQAGIYDWDLVTDTLDWDARTRELFGLSPGEVPSYGLFLERLHPDDRLRLQQAVARALDDPAFDGNWRERYRVKVTDADADADGAAQRWRWLESPGHIFFEGEGAARRAVRLVGLVRDVTEQVEADETIRQQEAFLRTVIDTIPVGIVTCEAPSGRVIQGNRRAEEIFGHPLLHSQSVDEYPEWVAYHADGRRYEAHEYPPARVILGGEERPEMEMHYQRGDGRLAWVRLVAAPIRDAAGVTRQVVVASLDVDAERRALEALHEADARKNEFLAMLAHELRNPLAPVLNAARLLERRETLSEPGREALAMIERQARHMKRLVDDLLEVSRVTRGLVQLQPEPMLLTSTIGEMVQAVMPAIEGRNQTLDIVQPTRPIKLHADPVRIAQIIENLLTNASKYTPTGGAIRIEVAWEEREVWLRVTDNGIGIEPDKLEAVFELFVQAEPGGTEHRGGLGIGLSMVRRLVELHGGRVWAESAGRGQGTTVVVRLPLVAVASGASPA